MPEVSLEECLYLLDDGLGICFEMIEKQVKFLHLLPESLGQMATAIFPKFSVEPEPSDPLKTGCAS